MSGSVSYVFYAIEKPLTNAQRSAVAELSRRAQPSARRVDFWYNVDGYDLPHSYESLLAKYYDIMVRQDYGLWTLAMAWDYDKALHDALKPFQCDDQDMVGIRVEPIDANYSAYGARKRARPTRLLAEISAFIDYDAIASIEGLRELPWERASADADAEDEEEDEYEGEYWYEDEFADDPAETLARLTNCIREDVTKGDVRAFYLAWKKLCGSARRNPLPATPRLNQLPRYLKGFARRLALEPQ